MSESGSRFIESHLLLTALSMRSWGVSKNLTILKETCLQPRDDTSCQIWPWGRRLEQRHGRAADQVIKWVTKPKIHYFQHTLDLAVRRRENPRHYHCFTDEDGMRWLKTVSRSTSTSGGNFERRVLAASRLRLKLTSLKAAILNKTASRRSKR